MGLQHSTERPARKDYDTERYDTMQVREDVEKGDDMIARTLIISVKKSPKRKASPKKMTPKKKTTPKRKASPKKKKSMTKKKSN